MPRQGSSLRVAARVISWRGVDVRALDTAGTLCSAAIGVVAVLGIWSATPSVSFSLSKTHVGSPVTVE
jgi:uncharacterized membrane protein YhiD involved in acid resistance